MGCVKKKSKKRSIGAQLNTILIIVFVFNAIFFPNDTFNLKLISLIALLIINIPLYLNKRKMSHENKVILIFGFFLTVYNILLSSLLTGDIMTNIQMGYPGLILLLFPIIKHYKIDFKKITISIIKLMAYFIALMAILDLLRIVDLMSNNIAMWFYMTSNAMIGKGSHLPIHYMIFMKTSPLIFIALADSIKRRKRISSLFMCFAIILSGTRANIFILVGFLVVYFCFIQKNKKLRYFAAVAVLLIGVALIIDRRVINAVVDIFVRKADSDATRDGHLRGIMEFWKSNPLKFIIGSGFSSSFYSYGVNDYAVGIELSYWNLLRQVGFISFIFMMVMFIYPIIKLCNNKANILYIIAYIAYLIIAYTNPFLYSSTGMLLLLFMYCKTFGSSFKPNKSKTVSTKYRYGKKNMQRYRYYNGVNCL